jgi:hypothetical protein
MEFCKCGRGQCRPSHTEHSYRVDDRHSIWCAAPHCYRHAIGPTVEQATVAWEALLRSEDRPSGEAASSAVSDMDDAVST